MFVLLFHIFKNGWLAEIQFLQPILNVKRGKIGFSNRRSCIIKKWQLKRRLMPVYQPKSIFDQILAFLKNYSNLTVLEILVIHTNYMFIVTLTAPAKPLAYIIFKKGLLNNPIRQKYPLKRSFAFNQKHFKMQIDAV